MPIEQLRLFKVWQMGRAGHFRCPRIRQFPREVPVAASDIGEVELAADQQRRHGQFGQAVDGAWRVAFLRDLRISKRDAIHVEEQVADRAGNPTLGAQRPVQPEMGLDGVDPVEIAIFLGLVEGGGQRFDARRRRRR